MSWQVSPTSRLVRIAILLLAVGAVLGLKTCGYMNDRSNPVPVARELPPTAQHALPAVNSTEPPQRIADSTEVYTPQTKWNLGYDIGSIPHLPHGAYLPLDDRQTKTYRRDGGLFWIAAKQPTKPSRDLPCAGNALVARRWDPATGEVRDSSIGGGTIVYAQTPVADGQVFLSNLKCDAPTASLLTSDGVLSSARIPMVLSGTHVVRFADLNEHSLAIVVFDRATKQITVLTMRWSKDSLQLDPMPVLDEKYRNDFAVAALDSDRLLVLGGSNDKYRGCLEGCRAETYLLDMKTKTWSKGPSMLEPRSEFAATRLPDGGILVAGGWTPTMNWSVGPSRTAERLDPETNRFEPFASLPSPNARHRFIKSADESENLLLAVDGMSNTVQAYDLVARRWFVATSWPTGNREGGCSFMPFIQDGQVFAWTVLAYVQQYGTSETCNNQEISYLSVFRTLMNAEPSVAPPESLLITYRANTAFLSARDGKPALAIGGASDTGTGHYFPSSAVDGFTLTGAMLALPTIQIARYGATAFHFGDGMLVVGGQGESKTTNSSKVSLPMEWLPYGDRKSDWKSIIVPDSDVALSSAITQLNNGNLLEVDSMGQATELKLVSTNESFRVERIKWPPLTRPRSNSAEQRLLVRQISDGRVIVAGGSVQPDRIAILKPDSNEINSVDEYISVGAYEPAKTYEIFDPAAKRWSESASATAGAVHMVILDDGRVIKARRMHDAESKFADVLELSDPQGKSWQTLKSEPAAAMLYFDSRFRMFVMEGELFASGAVAAGDGQRDSNLEWFNAASGKWEVLWRGKEFASYANEGRVVVRKLANGKSMVIPVEGL